MVVSALVRVEVPAAIWRKQRAGLRPFDAAADLAQAFEADWIETRFAVLRLRLTDDTLASAGASALVVSFGRSTRFSWRPRSQRGQRTRASRTSPVSARRSRRRRERKD
jgi:hypothetical protein